jgi:Heparinase II/III-like protein/Heparinase II/III N-terminus
MVRVPQRSVRLATQMSARTPPSPLARGRRQLEALRAARTRQLIARVRRPINRRWTAKSRLPRPPRPIEPAASFWRSRAFALADEAASGLGRGAIDVLGAEVSYPPDWNGRGLTRLRRFHLHYGDEILGCARLGGSYLERAHAGIASWIEQNRRAAGDGWHPYPLSTRIGNWLAAFTLEPSLATREANTSVWQQLQFLERNVEDDILGNHVIRNARALVLGGLAFDEPRLVDRGLRLVEREVPEQILSDGGHYERSPVYHALVLRDLLEIRATADATWLDAPLRKMAAFAAALRRPDGNLALFNDGATDIAPDLDDVLPEPASGVFFFPETGYLVVRRDDDQLWLAVDCGAAAPPYLPPHAHADALSFQLWFGRRPVVIDPGTKTYDGAADRNWFRGTPAHATVSIDGEDQFRLWGAFRATGIPEVEVLEVEGSELEGSITAQVDAFRHVGTVRHRRRVAWSAESVSVEDRLEGRGRRSCESSLPLAPGAVTGTGREVYANEVRFAPIGGLACTVEERQVSERFYEAVPAPAVVLRGEVELPLEIGWTIRRDAG